MKNSLLALALTVLAALGIAAVGCSRALPATAPGGPSCGDPTPVHAAPALTVGMCTE
jgi:hypothetical protein